MGEDSPITLAEVAVVVKKLPSSKALGMDDICCKMLKALVVTIFKKGNRRIYSSLRGITLLGLPWESVGADAPTDYRTPDSGDGLRFSPRLWNSKPDLSFSQSY